MNISNRKLFSSAQNNNIHYRMTDLIEIPENKDITDIAMYFQMARSQHSTLSNTPAIFHMFMTGYFKAIEFKLNQFTKIQRKLSAQGVSDKLFNSFSVEATTLKSDELIQLEFKLISGDYDSLSFLSFSEGYKMAEQNVISICHFIETERHLKGLSKESVYTNFWDFVESERVNPDEQYSAIVVH